MNTQTLTTPMLTCNFVLALPEEPICASSRDYGFDFSEAELAEALLAPLPANLADQPIAEVKADEVEQTFHYFLL
jgi:hypothetical protein